MRTVFSAVCMILLPIQPLAQSCFFVSSMTPLVSGPGVLSGSEELSEVQ